MFSQCIYAATKLTVLHMLLHELSSSPFNKTSEYCCTHTSVLPNRTNHVGDRIKTLLHHGPPLYVVVVDAILFDALLIAQGSTLMLFYHCHDV